MQSTYEDLRTFLCIHSNRNINSPRNQLFKFDGLLWFGVICDFLYLVPTYATVLSLFQSPSIYPPSLSQVNNVKKKAYQI